MLGCFFDGVFAVKVLAVRLRGLPSRTLPVVGRLVFANEPDSGSGGPTTPGEQVFAASCSRCHRADGGGAMPSFGGQLSPAQIRQVVEYTRTL